MLKIIKQLKMKRERVKIMDAYEEFGEDILNTMPNDVDEWDDETLVRFCCVMKRHGMFSHFCGPQDILDDYHGYAEETLISGGV